MLVGSGEAVRSLPQASLLTLERTTHLCGTCPLVMLERKGVLERVPPPHPPHSAQTAPARLRGEGPSGGGSGNDGEGGGCSISSTGDASKPSPAPENTHQHNGGSSSTTGKEQKGAKSAGERPVCSVLERITLLFRLPPRWWW